MGLIDTPIRRREVLLGGATAALMTLSGCTGDDGWNGVDVSGTLPDLSFTLMRASDGKRVTEADYAGRVVTLFFGYTFCPDICPMTLSNLAEVTERLGDRAKALSILFVTVDPRRDTRNVLKKYVSGFTPRADGLRGTGNHLAAVARRYRVTYKVEPDASGGYSVSHGQSVYVFDQRGEARLLLPRFSTGDADIEGATSDLRRLVDA